MSKFSKEKEDTIVQMYLYGVNQVEIAEYFKTFNTSIRRVLLRNNIPIISFSERQRKVLPTVFNDYNNQDIQYWLGVIASDGCITKGKLVVETKDKEWMEQYRDFLNPNINLNVTQPKKGNILYRVQFRSKGITEELLKYGITENKSLSLKWNYPITPAFFRGVLDGDGCIVYTEKTKYVRVSICGGSIEFIKQLQEFLTNNNIRSIINTTIRNGNTLYYLHVHYLEDKKKLFNLLYNNANYFLKRKKEKFFNVLNQHYK